MPQEIQHIPGVGEVQTTTVPTPVVEDQQSDVATLTAAQPAIAFHPAKNVTEYRVVTPSTEKR